jgi:Fe(3+) dicitrate transport protein
MLHAASDVPVLEAVTVTGGQEAVWQLPGSAAVVTAEEFRESGYTNFTRIAARIPGVYARDEDGYGNLINLSIRGVDGTRSNKVTLMEDGILTAPSPYSAPAAYYSPKLGRMAGIEVLKGSSQVAYGPHTTGGIINFLSTPIPAKESFYFRGTFGPDATWFGHGWYGNTFSGKAGVAGYVFEYHGQSTDGFRRIDGSSQDTGFRLSEPMLKLFLEPATGLRQRFEIKVGYSDFDANESYVGLPENFLRANPNRRLAATQFDRLTSEHWRTYLKHTVMPSDVFRIDTAIYHNTFQRTWDKLDGLSGAGLRTNVAEALVHAPSLAVLQGTGVGSIFTRNAYRDHEMTGIQTQADYTFETGSLDHTLSIGVRVHEDKAEGSNQTITYASNGLGGFNPPTFGAVQPQNRQSVLATSVFIEDKIRFGAITLRPGVRFENIDWKEITAGGVRTTGTETIVTGGLGFTWQMTTENVLFGGVYEGASPPNPSGFKAGTVPERSVGVELGVRHRGEAFRAEIVGFFTDFEDLIAPQVGIGAGGIAPSTNAGAAQSLGVESLVEYDFGKASNLDVGLPFQVAVTWTSAEFRGIPVNGRLGNGAGVFAGAVNGREIPYIPEWKLSAGFGVVHERWGVRADATYSSKTWGTGYNGSPRLNDGTNTLANPSTVDGRIDALFLVDVSGYYRINDNARVIAGIQNLFDERKLVSRIPLGPRANAPRFTYAGIEVTF